MNVVKKLGAVAVAVACTTCGSSKGSEKTDVAATAAAVPSPEGRWKSECITQDNGGQKSFVVMDFNITKDRWTLDYVTHGDDKCATPFITSHFEGPYKVGAASASVAGAYDGEFGFDKKTVKSHADAAVAVLTQACGAGTYTANAETDILEKGCAGFGSLPKADCGTDYDLVKIDGDKLHFGKRPVDNNMCSPEKRPKEIESTPLKKSI